MKKKLIQYILKILSRAILKKYRPDIIGITGSVGKTGTKLAIEMVLSDKFSVRSSQKNYNTEIGAPLAIIGLNNPGASIFGWLRVFSRGILLLLKRHENYPRVLILEMAADRPGDIKYLVNLTKPKIGIITSIGPTHLEFFEGVEGVKQEKSSMVSQLSKDCCAILNNDQRQVASLKNKTLAKVLTYGTSPNSIVRAEDIQLNQDKGGLTFKLSYENSSVQINLLHSLGQPAVYTALTAAAVGLYYDLSLEYIAERLVQYKPLTGRLNLLSGIKKTRIIDDSYNSSPLAARAALEVLVKLKCTGNKFAVLGDMLELGNYTKQAHRQTGEEVAKLGIDYLITVGERSLDTAESAKEYGMNPDRIFSFDSPLEAGKFIQDRIQQGDLILVKGSAGMSMEKIVREIMAEPGKAGELLVRQ